MKEFKIGMKVSILEDGKRFISGEITEIYEGTQDYKPCKGIRIDNGNGFLIDFSREVIDSTNGESLIPPLK